MSKNPFDEIGFEDFRAFAKNPQLSKYEKIGFPDSFRAGAEERIFADIRKKLTNLDKVGQITLDIGPGCSDLPLMLIEHCRQFQSHLYLIDSQEMLDLLPDQAWTSKYPAKFPECPDFMVAQKEKIDAILCYSVLHYILVDTAFFRFLDGALSLLAPGGQFLIADIPNVSKRKRFFSSANGIAFHKQFMNTEAAPEVVFNNVEHDKIDDAVIMAILHRARLQGFDAYVLPQDRELPMANRREDILIVRP